MHRGVNSGVLGVSQPQILDWEIVRGSQGIVGVVKYYQAYTCYHAQ